MPASMLTSRTLLLAAVALSLGACAADAPQATMDASADAAPRAEALPEAEERPDWGEWVMPSYAERALSNAYVSVYRYAVAPGDSVVLQEGESWFVFAEAGARLADDAGAAVSIAPENGELFERPTRLRNAGDETVPLVVVERTANPLPDRVKDGNPGVFLPDEAVQLNELGTDAVRVLSSEGGVLASHVRLAPGDVIPLHSGFSRVIYALSDYSVQRFGVQGFGGAGSDATVTRRRGDALWNTASNFAAENVGSTDVQALIVAYYE